MTGVGFAADANQFAATCLLYFALLVLPLIAAFRHTIAVFAVGRDAPIGILMSFPLLASRTCIGFEARSLVLPLPAAQNALTFDTIAFHTPRCGNMLAADATFRTDFMRVAAQWLLKEVQRPFAGVGNGVFHTAIDAGAFINPGAFGQGLDSLLRYAGQVYERPVLLFCIAKILQNSLHPQGHGFPGAFEHVIFDEGHDGRLAFRHHLLKFISPDLSRKLLNTLARICGLNRFLV